MMVFNEEQMKAVRETLELGEDRKVTDLELQAFVNHIIEIEESEAEEKVDTDVQKAFQEIILEGSIIARWSPQKMQFEFRLREMLN